jgi:hypothetical protein
MLALFGCLSIASWFVLLIFVLTVIDLRKLSRLPRLLGHPEKSVRAEAFAELMRQGKKPSRSFCKSSLCLRIGITCGTLPMPALWQPSAWVG